MIKKNSVTAYALTVITPYKFLLIIGLVASCCYGLIDALLIWFIKPLLDDGFIAKNIQFIYKIPVFLFCIFTCRALTAYVAQYTLAKVSYQAAAQLKEHLFKKLLSYPATIYENKPAAEFMTKISFKTTALATSMSEALSMIMRECVTIIGLLIVMFMASPLLTCLYLMSVPLSIAVFTFIGKKARTFHEQVHRSLEEKNNHLQEVIQGHLVVKSFGSHFFEMKKFKALVMNHLFYELKEARVLAQGSAFIQFIGGLVIMSIIYLSTTTGRTTLSGGDFTCLVTAILALLRPVKQLSKVNELWQKAITNAKSLLELEDYPQEMHKHQEEKNFYKPHQPAALSFVDVSFHYGQGDHREILSHISFELEPGQTVAIVGPSGGGKSTLVSLVPRLYDYQGSIFLDGQDIQQLPLAYLRKKTALVSQHIILFNDTIAANIAYGHDNIDWIAVKKAAQLAFSSDFIEQLPQGYLTLLGPKGYRLSGGQRQRIALARAFYKQAPLLILDEATSALDSESEDQIQRALSSLMAQSSTLVIAHRLSTIMNAHKILVIDKGRLIEQGTHNELIRQQGFYAQLYQQTLPEENLP
jgi:subfamily B ATP-binding cassette protein MsbA